MIGELPRSLNVNGINYLIRTNIWAILDILKAFADPELKQKEKIYVCLFIIYKDFENLKTEDYEEAFKQAMWFIDNGTHEEDDKPPLHVMDWEQDEKLLWPAVNDVAGFEIRNKKYMHWWTFLGHFMSIKDGIYAEVIRLRVKKAKHKKLEKYEQEFWSSNKDICVLKQRLTKEEQEAKDRLNKMLG